MRLTALLLAASLALGASPAHAAEPAPGSRGFLTGLGLGLLIGGLAGAGAGAAGAVSSNDASQRLAAYGSGAVEEQASMTALRERASGGLTLSLVGFIAGGLALAAGVTCLVLDAPGLSTSLVFVPGSQGGVFVLSARF